MKKLLQANAAGGVRRVSQVFRDFVELVAITIRNSVDPVGREDREARYLHIVAGYTPEEANRFSEALALLVLELEKGLSDALGHLYMSLDLGNERIGQFFTPYSVSVLTAKITLADLADKVAGMPYMRVQEPACGSGGMVIAMADAMRDAGLNYQQKMHVTATDLDITAVHMAYVQLSLLHIPAVVVHGNTLTVEEFDSWPTPAHVLGMWELRLAQDEEGAIEEFVLPRAS